MLRSVTPIACRAAGAAGRSLFSALLLVSFAPFIESRPSEPQMTLSGKAIVMELSRLTMPSKRFLALVTDNGQHVQVESNTPIPSTAKTGMPVEAMGNWEPALQSEGSPARNFRATALRWMPGKLEAGNDGDGAADVAAAASVGGSAASRAVYSFNRLTSSQLRAVFIPIRTVDAMGGLCFNSSKPQFTLPRLRKVLFAESNPKGVTVGSTFNTCSYGKTKLTAKNSALVDWVKLPCKQAASSGGMGYKFGRCTFPDYNGLASAADDSLRSRGFPLHRYFHRVYIMPPGFCPGDLALGYVGCDPTFDCRAWMGSDRWHRTNTYFHEIGHHLFLAHAGAKTSNGDFDEYADGTCAQGYCCRNRCFNTPHAWQLGWLKVRQFDNNTLAPGQTVAVSMPSQSLSDSGSLRIVPSWAKDASDSIFVGFRTKAGGDAGLAASLANRVHIYTANIRNSHDASLTVLEASLKGGQSWSHTATGIVVRVGNVTATAAQVSVCRKGGADPTCEKAMQS